jgi:hypothetical protein
MIYIGTYLCKQGRIKPYHQRNTYRIINLNTAKWEERNVKTKRTEETKKTEDVL